MGQHYRHYKALMRKNWILWKRSWVASVCELICPVALMAILTLARLAVKVEHTDTTSMIEEASIYYPPTKFTSSNNYTNISAAIGAQYKDFYNFSDLDQNTAAPFLQFVNKACRERTFYKVRDVIAYGPSNTISQQVADYIKVTNDQRKAAISYFMNNTENGYLYQLETTRTIDFKFKSFDSKEEITAYIQHPRYGMDDDRPGICFAWSLNENSPSSYDLQMMFEDHEQEEESQAIPSSLQPSADVLQRSAQTDAYELYAQNGFAQLQNWIANAVLRKATGNADATIAMSTVPFKVDAYDTDNFSQIISRMLPFFMLLMFILPVYRTLSRILSEKETKARESMKMMGLKDFSYWLSWFTYYILVTFVISLLCTILLAINVVKYTNRFILFLYFFIYGISLFGLIVFFQSFFSSARVGAIAGTLIYFGTSFVDSVVQDEQVSQSRKLGASILSTVGVTRGAQVMGIYEIAGVGITFKNINNTVNNFSFGNSLVMMSISFFVFLIIGIYLENVLPSTYGLRKPFYFFLMPSYWCGERRRNQKKVDQMANVSVDQESHEFIEHKYIRPENFEPPSQDLRKLETEQKILCIEELKKTFDNGFKAVKGVNVKMYNGQIFALLGHNGAGKTTTISMLTGLLSSSHGQAEIFGYDLFNQMNEVRKFLGVCPQHDILFDMLTPVEHLEIFCDFKGVDKKTQKAEINKMILDVDLVSHKNVQAKNLSGGGKRKLSVAIALIGGSKFVLLDEPTAGMDLSARRRLWNMLKNYKHNRIIILTTHYMDEADILGDRIGIMTDGQLICLGSSLFLKNRFGVGYNLTMVKKTKEPNLKIGPYLHERLGDVKKLSEVSSEITYQIPTSLSDKFKDFFTQFDSNLDALGLRSYGISVTTLEEVFLRVGHPDKLTDQVPESLKEEEQYNSTQNLAAQNQEIMDNYSIAEQSEHGVLNVFFIHLVALFRKKYFIYKKNYKGLLVEILIPVLLVIIGFAFSKVVFWYESPYKTLQPSLFPYKQRITVNQDPFIKNANSIQPSTLIGLLPDFQNAFSPTYKNYAGVNVTDGKISKVLYQFDDDVFASRFDGDLEPFRYVSYYIYEANNATKQFKVASFFNATSQDGAILSPQFMYEAIMKASTGNPNFKFNVTNAPFPLTAQLKDRAASISGMFIVFVIGIAFALIPAAIISQILFERETNLKQIQLITGMNLLAYWMSNLVFDILKAEIPMALVIGFLYAFGLDYKNSWTVFLMYPVGVVPFTYATSFVFNNESIGQTVTIFMHFVFAGIGGIVVYILRIIDSTFTIGDALFWALKVVPSFCLTNSVMFASSREIIIFIRGLPNDDFAMDNMGGDLLVLGLHFFFGIFCIIVCEGCLMKAIQKCFSTTGNIQPKKNLELDEDVLEEETRVEKYYNENYTLQRKQSIRGSNSHQEHMQVVVNKFRKVYATGLRTHSLAVEKTSFGLDFGECFALLGVNGAGKTTTFKSLTNEIVPTSGDIIIGGFNAKTQFSRIRKMIGYCPQHDCIFDLMTVEEHLDYYARIKGIVREKRSALIEKQIQDMNLEPHRKKKAGSLSGGNKRKLSVAIAVLGNPPIILLDEPSAGMDPEARRFMWSVVAKISQQRKKSAVILTTHSMEEAEALSTKMGIMVKGGIFRCFGSSQHIKNKFGTGYEIESKVRKLTQDDLKAMKQQFGLPQELESIPILQLTDTMRRLGVDELVIQELNENGYGSDLYKEALEMNGHVSVSNFLTWLHVEIHGLRIIYGLIEVFGSVEVLEHYNDYYKMRIPRVDKSIGYVFGFIESKKELFGISEYSVSQTTLEQIFQAFANLEIDSGNNGVIYQKDNGGRIVKARKLPALSASQKFGSKGELY